MGLGLSYRDRVLAKIRPYEHADLDDVVSFRAAMYGEEAFFAEPGYVRWMYESTFGNGSVRSPMWLFRSDGKVEGQQGGIRTRVRVGDETYDALWSIELVVSPEFLLRGVGAVLSGLVARETSVILAFEVTELARKVLARDGWGDLGDVPLFVRPLNVGALLGARGRSVPRPVAGALNVLLRGGDVVLESITAARRLRLEEVTRFDERSDAIWAASAPHYQMITQRDPETLNWRYVDYPRAGYYRTLYLYRGADCVGHAVLRVGEHNELPAGWIVDFLCPPALTHGLLTASTRWLRREGVAAVYCIHQRTHTARSFTTAGFLRRSTGWRLMARTNGLPDAARAIVMEPSNWFITGGDSNVDHPREGTDYAT